MARTFTEMKTKVGNFVEDTDTSLLTLIGEWINDKYTDAYRRCNWGFFIDNDYTFATVASTASYNLPSDFEQELFVSNITDGEDLTRATENKWWSERFGAYSGGTIDSSSPRNYLILRQALKTDNTGFGKISLDPTPDAVVTVAMPYKKKFVPLLGTTGTCTTDTANKIIASASTFLTSGVKPGMVVKNTTDNTYGYVTSVDSETQLTMDVDLCPDGNETFVISNEVFVNDLDWILELGAIAELYAYKKNFAKADYYAQKYETELEKRINQEFNLTNQLYQNEIADHKIGGIHRLTGNSSYDTI